MTPDDISPDLLPHRGFVSAFGGRGDYSNSHNNEFILFLIFFLWRGLFFSYWYTFSNTLRPTGVNKVRTGTPADCPANKYIAL